MRKKSKTRSERKKQTVLTSKSPQSNFLLDQKLLY